jgi:Arc/MetJ-type ribon-helix-helix transcriptional regulator
MSVSVNLRLAEGIIKVIDEAVKTGMYKSRAQFCELAVYKAIEDLNK